jgi:hypothetical protein
LSEHSKGREQARNVYDPEEEKAHQENKGNLQQAADVHGNQGKDSMTKQDHEKAYQKSKNERHGNARSERSENMGQDKSNAVNKTIGLPLGKVHPKNKCR